MASRMTRDGGYTYVGLLIAVALAGVALAAAGTHWSTSARREREAQLVFAGVQYRNALESYAAAHQGTQRPYPSSLAELIEDRRTTPPRRHLRRLYAEPVGGNWVLIRTAAGGIVGVHSDAGGKPLRRVFPPDLGLGEAEKYADWKFVARGPLQQTAANPALAGAGGAAAGADRGAPSDAGEEPPPDAAAPPRRPACGALREQDLAVCLGVQRLRGDERAAECRRTADMRQGACALGDDLPSLIMN